MGVRESKLEPTRQNLAVATLSIRGNWGEYPPNTKIFPASKEERRYDAVWNSAYLDRRSGNIPDVRITATYCVLVCNIYLVTAGEEEHGPINQERPLKLPSTSLLSFSTHKKTSKASTDIVYIFPCLRKRLELHGCRNVECPEMLDQTWRSDQTSHPQRLQSLADAWCPP